MQPEDIIQTGDIIIQTVIRAAAIERAVQTEDGGWIFIWASNAAEQIEAALADAGYALCPNS